MNIIEKIEKIYNDTPNKIAVKFDDICLTYKELWEKSCYLSKKIEERNLSKNNPVIIISERNERFIIGILSVMISGHFFIPIEIPYPEQRIYSILRQFDNNIILIEKDNALLIDMQIREKSIFINWVDEKVSDWEKKTDSLVYSGKDICYAIFTSGSTGMPKGVTIRNESIENLINVFLEKVYRRYNGNFNVGVLASFSFDASLKQIFGSLFYGGTLCIAKREDKIFSLRLQSFLTDNNIQIIDGTKSIYKIMMRKKKVKKVAVDYYLIGGEMLTWEFINEFYTYMRYNPTVINVYGPTECCIDASSYWITKDNLKKSGIVPIGKPIENAYFELKDINVIKNRKIGELYITGILVGNGYINHDNDSFIHNQQSGLTTFKSGDLCFLDKDGNYVTIGRSDNQLKINGNRIELLEVENCLRQYDGVSDVFVDSFYQDEDRKIYAVILQKKDLSSSKIMDFLRERLPNYGIPYKLFFTQKAFPINRNGKIDKEKMYLEYVK